MIIVIKRGLEGEDAGAIKNWRGLMKLRIIKNGRCRTLTHLFLLDGCYCIEKTFAVASESVENIEDMSSLWCKWLVMNTWRINVIEMSASVS